MNKFFTTHWRLGLLLAGLATTALAVILIPAAMNAWGPDRPTYTIKKPADHVTFNSITDNPNIGDERNFVGIRENNTNGKWQDEQQVKPGKEYVVRMYVHNNAAANLKKVAKNTTASFNLPTKTDTSIQVNGFLSATNASPQEVYDHATFKGSEKFNLSYVKGSAKYFNNANGNGFSIPESLFTSNGAKLGYDKMNGDLPGCFQYAGYLTFIVKPQFAKKQDFTMEKKVSKHGANKWADTYKAAPGEKVDFLLKYKNTGDAQQDNVTFRDALPNHLSYVNGSTTFGNSQHPNGTKASDKLTTDGINVGSYKAGANAWSIFSAKVADKKDLKCGTTTMTNTASVTPGGLSPKQDSADVTVEKDCDTPKPKKIEVCDIESGKVITINEKDFDSKRHSKDLSDCEEKTKTIKVCDTTTNKIVTIDEKDFDSKRYSKDLDDCKTTPAPVKIEVCDTTTNKIVTIDKDDFDSSRYSKDLNDCKDVTPPAELKVCDTTTNKIVTIDEKDFDSSRYSKDLSDCKTAPSTPVETPSDETPAELPETGKTTGIVSVIGASLLAAMSVFYLQSRRLS